MATVTARRSWKVKLVAGGVVEVQTKREADWFNQSRDAYLAEVRFTENTDTQDLDRLLQMELLLWRWNQAIISGYDNQGTAVDEKDLHGKMKVTAEAVSKLKDQMALTRKVRDAAGSSVADRWADLLARAKAFGYMRESQLRTALVLMNDLSGIVGAFDRSDAEERKKLGYETEHDILEWIRDTMLPSFHQVDAHFQQEDQKLWRRL